MFFHSGIVIMTAQTRHYITAQPKTSM